MGKRSVGCLEWDACLGCSAVGTKVYHPLSPRAVSSQSAAHISLKWVFQASSCPFMSRAETHISLSESYL